MVVTIQLVSGDDSAAEVRVASEVEIVANADPQRLADAVAARARDAALLLVEHERALAPVASGCDFVPLACLLPRA
jgi:hypothetical protein